MNVETINRLTDCDGNGEVLLSYDLYAFVLCVLAPFNEP